MTEADAPRWFLSLFSRGHKGYATNATRDFNSVAGKIRHGRSGMGVPSCREKTPGNENHGNSRTSKNAGVPFQDGDQEAGGQKGHGKNETRLMTRQKINSDADTP